MTEPATGDVAGPVVERAIALAREGSQDHDGARELSAVGRGQLEKAQAALVRRLSQRSDDYEATAALNMVNKALAMAGWEDPYNWKHRRKP